MYPEIRSGNEDSQAELLRFINSPQLAFEYLDWFPSRSRLAEPSTFYLCSEQGIAALISVAPEKPSFAWIRFFYSWRDGRHGEYFSKLLNHACDWLIQRCTQQLYCLAPNDWVENLLVGNAFQQQNQIISLSTPAISGSAPMLKPGIRIRPTRLGDLPQIEELDNICFQPPWQMNPASVEKSYFACEYASLAEVDGSIVAYQMTTRTFDNLHLARIAVHPDFRGLGIARALLFDLKEHFEDTGVESVSVNTPVDNKPSLRLYHSLGFRQVGSLLPVFQKQL